MNIPGLLIEYLMTGGLAVVLLAPIFLPHIPEVLMNLTGSKALATLVAVPFVYVIGLILDSASSLGLKPLKKKIRKGVRASWSEKGYPLPNKGDERLLTTYIWNLRADLGKEYEARSSRDRIARGALLNFLIAAVVYSCTRPGFALVCGLAAVVIFPIWWRSEKASFAYKLKAWYMSSEAGQRRIGHDP